MSNRVVITNWAMVSSLGTCTREVLENIKKENTTFKSSDMDPEVVVCPVESFDLKTYTGPFKNRRYLNRGAAFSVASAVETIVSSELKQEELQSTGLYVGTGPNLDITQAFSRTQSGEPDFSENSALWILEFLANTPASIISQLGSIHAESLSIQTACAASLQSIGEAYRKIKDGYIATALAGGGDSRINPGAIMAYKKAQAIHKGPGDPKSICRPFDSNRGGFVIGEGGAFFLLESLEKAKARRANIIAEICGIGSSMDGHSMTAPTWDGECAECAIRNALLDAGWDPWHIDLVSTHGTGTFLNDAVEAKILKRIFENNQTLLTAIKSWIGHLSAACGAVEMAILLSCIRHGYIPKIRNLESPCREDLFLMSHSQERNPRRILFQNFGFGGQNCALVIEKRD